MVSQQNMNLTVSFVADSVNLRPEFLARRVGILIEQRLDTVMMLAKQNPDLLLLFWSQLQVFRNPSKFLIDRLWRMDLLKLLLVEAPIEPTSSLMVSPPLLSTGPGESHWARGCRGSRTPTPPSKS
jgi:hypothetical protein